MKLFLPLLLIVGFIKINPALSQTKAYTLLIGMDVINDQAYLKKYDRAYDQAGTAGVFKDIAALRRITGPNNHIVKELRGKEATRAAILKAITEIGEKVKVGDQFLLYYSGHGDIIADVSGDEQSGFDQVMVAYDDFLVDDEIDRMMVKYFTKTKNVMIVDACHSGSSYKILTFFADFKLRSGVKNKFIGESLAFKQKKEIQKCEITTVIDEPYNLLYLGATPDGELAQGDLEGGLLTKLLNIIIRDARKRGDWNKYTYEKLACELYQSMKKNDQDLQFLEIGKDAQAFAKSTPFKSQ